MAAEGGGGGVHRSTAQAPRVGRGAQDSLYELEVASATRPHQKMFRLLAAGLVDRLFRNLLIDAPQHAPSEFSIDSLFRLKAPAEVGLVEMRAFEMPRTAAERAQHLLLPGHLDFGRTLP